MFVNVYIVDSEQINIDRLKYNFKNLYGDTCHVKSETNPIKALECLKEEPVDLLLLAVEMREMGGFRLLKKLRETVTDFQVAFLATSDQYALNAFRVDAWDDILRLISPKDLQRVVRKSISYKEKKDLILILRNLQALSQ